MHQNSYHGILVDMAFVDRHFPETFSLFAQKKIGNWEFYGIEVLRENLEEAIRNIQTQMRTDEEFYNHLYDYEELIVIFKERVFRATSHNSSWREVQQYGLSLDIPIEQLDFWPNRFQEEVRLFGRDSFIKKMP